MSLNDEQMGAGHGSFDWRGARMRPPRSREPPPLNGMNVRWRRVNKRSEDNRRFNLRTNRWFVGLLAGSAGLSPVVGNGRLAFADHRGAEPQGDHSSAAPAQANPN